MSNKKQSINFADITADLIVSGMSAKNAYKAANTVISLVEEGMSVGDAMKTAVKVEITLELDDETVKVKYQNNVKIPMKEKKFKTVACKWLNTTVGCKKGEHCTFSHDSASAGAGSSVEQVESNDEPRAVKKTMMPFYKSVMCKKYDTEEGCPYGKKCNFAHGKDELRSKKGPTKD